MLRSRLAAWMVFGGVLLVLAGSGWLSSVAADWEQANGSRRLQKLTVNVDRSVGGADSAGLSLREADRLAKQWSPLPIAYSGRAQTRAVNGRDSAECDVFGVNAGYRQFAEYPMLAGTSIAQTSVDERSRVAVIGLQAADRLFRSGQVVGKTIELFGAAFTVIGVFDDSRTLLRDMADDGIPDVLVPAAALFDVKPDARIDTMQLAMKPDSIFGGEDAAKAALLAIGKNPEHYRVASEALAYRKTAQLGALLRFGCGAIAIALLAGLVIRRLKAACVSLQSRLAAEYLSDALRSEWRRLLADLLAAAGLALCAAVLWELIRFRPYIPPDWVPEQLIDLSFYWDKLRSLWQQQAVGAGYVPSPQERLTDAASRLSGRLLFAGIFFGLPLFLLGVRLWTMSRVPVYAQLQKLFLYMPVSAAAAFAGARWAGLDFRIEPPEYAVIGAFFIVAIIHSHYSKGVKHVYVEQPR